jgi:ABC-type transport system involved in cytochrome c biogenesis permease subunit
MEVWQGTGETAPAVLPPLVEGGEWRKPGYIRELAFATARHEALRWAQQNNLPQNMAELNDQQKKELVDVFEKAEAKATAEDPAYVAWEAMLAAYRSGNADEFAKKVSEFAALSEKTVPAADLARVRFESFLNTFAPFYRCAFLYGLALLLTFAGWATTAFNTRTGNGFRRAAFGVLLLTVAVHTFGLFARMYLMDRPLVFVTNLYSSAVFIGWAAAVICLIVERIYPLGIGNFVAAALGIGTSIVAHNLSFEKDTLEMMQAVLDTNFWLATHVTTVTLGYSATYVAAVVALTYVILGVFTPLLKKPVEVGPRSSGRPADLGRVIASTTYGIICLAMLFSFVGTVLGGIWADQSWGRFWGWDPKENGAVLIVTWNALILHARWSGLVKDRGVAVLAIAGAIVTTWSWFGTNLLGVGLHFYGFNQDLRDLCIYVWIASATAVLLGLVPKSYWVSFAELPVTVPTGKR